jgi:hypothetical protein
VTCQAPALESITVSAPKECEVPQGGTIQLTATGNYASGAPKNLTSTAAWSSSNTNVATVSAGLVMCKATRSHQDGNAIIRAAVGSASGSIGVTCEGLGR